MVQRVSSAALVIVCFVLVSCSKQPSGQGGTFSSAPIRIERLDPSFTIQGKAFNLQPDGQAALAIVGAGIPPESVLLWDGQPLKIGGGGSQGWASVGVPANLYAEPGTKKLVLHGTDGATLSNTIEFTVYALTGPPPAVAELYPPTAVANKGFNLQPNGVSALGVTGSGFLPGAKIFFGGAEVNTSFSDSAKLTAAIPNALATRAGRLEVWVANPDGKTSNKTAFQIGKE